MMTEKARNNSSWGNALCFLFGVALTAALFIVREIYIEDVPLYRVDNAIQRGIASADIELDNIAGHEANTRERVVVIREKVWAEIEALSPDALVTRAMERAERMRGIIASDDNQDAGGIFTE